MESSIEQNVFPTPPSTIGGIESLAIITQQQEEEEEAFTPEETFDPPPTARESQILEGIFQKQYDQGDAGKLDALHDLQGVFNELKDEEILPPFDLLGTYNAPPVPSDQVKTPRKKAKTRKAMELTPRPPGGLLTDVTAESVPNLLKNRSRQDHHSELKKDATLSLPSLTIPPLGSIQKSPRGKSSKGGKKIRPRHAGGHHIITKKLVHPPSARPPPPSTQESETTSAHSTTSPRPKTPLDELELDRQTSQAIDVVTKDLELVTYYKEHMLQQPSTPVDTGDKNYDPDELWKADLNKLTRARSSGRYSKPISEGETVKLKYKHPVWPHQLSLHQILSRMPTLTCLILDGSELQFLRDLGSSLPSLMTLSVAKCGLRSLDGTLGFPNLRTLIASDNEIRHPTECSYLTTLNHLDLCGNPIQDFEGFVHLRVCTKLRSLKLHATPISRALDFHPRMKFLLPQLKELFPIIVVSKESKMFKARNEKQAAAAAMDPLKAMMKMNLDLAYQKIVDKPRPTGIGYQKSRTKQSILESLEVTTAETSETSGTPVTAETSSTEDNFESLLMKNIRGAKRRRFRHADSSNINEESYITDITETEETDSPYTSTFSTTPFQSDSGQGDSTSTDFSFESSSDKSGRNTARRDSYKGTDADTIIQELYSSNMKQRTSSSGDYENETDSESERETD